jgi:hypothetical protein
MYENMSRSIILLTYLAGFFFFLEGAAAAGTRSLLVFPATSTQFLKQLLCRFRHVSRDNISFGGVGSFVGNIR